MLDDILYRLASVLTPDKVKQMKAAGMGELAEAIVVELESMERMLPRPINTQVQARLTELRAACVNDRVDK